MKHGLLWAAILGFIIFLIIPFPLSFILCIIVGAVIPWIGGNNNQNQNKKDIDR